MAIIINEHTHVLVQGITGYQGSFHTRQMLSYGTKIVAGVTPGRGETQVEGVPVYDSVRAALENHHIQVLFTPGAVVKAAAFEALEAGIETLVILAEHVPLHDSMEIMAFSERVGARIIGPNTYGIVSPGKCKIGIAPSSIFSPGTVGVVARSGTLSYEIVADLTARGLGQSSVVGIGGDRVIGLSFGEMLRFFEAYPETQAVVLVGEIGGSAEEDTVHYIKEMTKPVIAYIAGRTAPPGKRMGHAGAIIERGKGTHASKIAALATAGVRVASLPSEVAPLVRAELERVQTDPLYGLVWPQISV